MSVTVADVAVLLDRAMSLMEQQGLDTHDLFESNAVTYASPEVRAYWNARRGRYVTAHNNLLEDIKKVTARSQEGD